MITAIDVSDLPRPLVDAIQSLVSTYRERMNAPADEAPPERPIGWLKGAWELPESFFEPLPEDVLELFEGGGGQ
jgi:hypothetical protein